MFNVPLFPSADFRLRAEAYTKFSGELKNVETLKEAALKKIRSKVETRYHEELRLISSKAESKMKREESKIRAKIDEKLQQLQMDDQLLLISFSQTATFAVAKIAAKKFEIKLKELQLSFKRSMEEAKETFICGHWEFWNDPKNMIDDLSRAYKKDVEEAWKAFKQHQNLSTKLQVDISTATASFSYKSERARKRFEAEVNKFHGGFSGEIGDLAKAKTEYENAVDKCVEDFTWGLTSAFQYFCGAIDQVKGENNSTPLVSLAQPQPQQQQPQPAQEQQQQQKSSEEKDKRVENLERQVAQLLDNIWGINNQLLALQETQRQQQQKMEKLSKELLENMARRVFREKTWQNEMQEHPSNGRKRQCWILVFALLVGVFGVWFCDYATSLFKV